MGKSLLTKISVEKAQNEMGHCPFGPFPWLRYWFGYNDQPYLRSCSNFRPLSSVDNENYLWDAHCISCFGWSFSLTLEFPTEFMQRT